MTTTSAPSAQYRYQAYPAADHVFDVPGLAVTFAAEAGDAVWLQASGLLIGNVTALAQGKNVGNTVYGLVNTTGISGGWWGGNLTPTAETRVYPLLRWLFLPASSATYAAKVAVTSYSTIVGRDYPTVTMRVYAGATLRADVTHGARWLLPSSPSPVAAGGRCVLLSGPYPRACHAYGDAQITTTGATGSTVRLTLTAAFADRAALSASRTVTISHAKHHCGVGVDLAVPEAADLSLAVECLSGDPITVAGGGSRGAAATRLVAVELP